MGLTDEMGARYLAIGSQRYHIQAITSAANNVYWTTFKAGSQGSNLEYTWPTTMPGTNNLMLTATTGGVMSWASSFTADTFTFSADVKIGNNLLVNTASAGSTAEGMIVLGNFAVDEPKAAADLVHIYALEFEGVAAGTVLSVYTEAAVSVGTKAASHLVPFNYAGSGFWLKVYKDGA